jgi:hypothetical protein
MLTTEVRKYQTKPESKGGWRQAFDVLMVCKALQRENGSILNLRKVAIHYTYTAI